MDLPLRQNAMVKKCIIIFTFCKICYVRSHSIFLSLIKKIRYIYIYIFHGNGALVERFSVSRMQDLKKMLYLYMYKSVAFLWKYVYLVYQR